MALSQHKDQNNHKTFKVKIKTR